METIYGYARCSTNEDLQDIDRQKRELKKLGVKKDEHIYCEYESGTKKDRAELNKLLSAISYGDTIIVTEVSRLSRSTSQLCEILDFIKNNHIRLIIGNFVADCRSDELEPMTKGMLMMWSVFSEMERDMISERVKSGLANAKAKGKKIGRPKFDESKIPSVFFKHYPKYFKKELNVTEFAKLVGCSRTTLYRYLNTIKNK